MIKKYTPQTDITVDISSLQFNVLGLPLSVPRRLHFLKSEYCVQSYEKIKFKSYTRRSFPTIDVLQFWYNQNEPTCCLPLGKGQGAYFPVSSRILHVLHSVFVVLGILSQKWSLVTGRVGFKGSHFTKQRPSFVFHTLVKVLKSVQKQELGVSPTIHLVLARNSSPIEHNKLQAIL